MMLSSAFQSRKMESMGSRNLGSFLPGCATILQESVLARSGGRDPGLQFTPLFVPFPFSVCSTPAPPHNPPGSGVAGRHGEGGMHRILQNSYSASWRSTCCTTTIAPEREARLLASRLETAIVDVGVGVGWC